MPWAYMYALFRLCSIRDGQHRIPYKRRWFPGAYIPLNRHNLAQVNEIVRRTPWNNRARWECLVKARDGSESGAKVEIFPVTDNSASKLNNANGSTRDYQDCDEYGKNYELDEIEIRVKRGKKAKYAHSGSCMRNGDRDHIREVFREMHWNEIKKQGLTVIDRAMGR